MMVCVYCVNNVCDHWLSTGLSQPLCDVVQSILCELFVNQDHVTLLSLLKSFVLLTKTYKKVLMKKQDLQLVAYIKCCHLVTAQNTQCVLVLLDVIKLYWSPIIHFHPFTPR